MGNSGYSIIEKFSGGKNTTTDWLSGNYTLPSDYPENLQTFIHLNANLTETSKVSIIRNGIPYVLNSDVEFIGVMYRSIPISKGDEINIQCDVTQTNLQFTLSLEK